MSTHPVLGVWLLASFDIEMTHTGRSGYSKVRIFKHISAPTFEIEGLTMGMSAFRILGLG